MAKKESIRLFEDKRVRTIWDDEQEKWYFSISDIIEVLTDSKDPKQYIKKMKSRDPELKSNWGTICTLVQMTSEDGKRHKEMAASTEGIFRIIQSIPSPKAEPFKRWMAKVAAERLDQLQDPELSIHQAMEDYKRLGYISFITTSLYTHQFRIIIWLMKLFTVSLIHHMKIFQTL